VIMLIIYHFDIQIMDFIVNWNKRVFQV